MIIIMWRLEEPLILQTSFCPRCLDGNYATVVGNAVQLSPILSIFHNFIDSRIFGELIFHNCFKYLQGKNNRILNPRGTKAHWINPYQFILAVWKEIISRESAIGTLSPIGSTHGNVFYCMQGNNIKRVSPRGTKAHWVNP